jgi:RecT family
MAEIEGTGAIVPASVASPTYALDITEFDAAGKRSTLSVPLPNDAKWGDVMLRAALLKRGGSWKNYDIPTILHAVVYADNLGLDIMAGDVYCAEEGRLSTTAGAKIKHAMQSGRVVGYSVEMTEGPEIEIAYQVKQQAQVWRGPNWKAEVTVKLRDMETPVRFEATLKEWFTGRNPNWRDRPSYMLRKNALSKAMEEAVPMGTEADEAPPIEIPALTAGVGGSK